ncbi:MAG TPA: glycine cleavage system aminomethyltransferase GcvT [Clostridiaceae bacterium]|nr:glycine cleavage system aminomethyltransferase GcvT [Clostridiaceae bacterium]
MLSSFFITPEFIETEVFKKIEGGDRLKKTPLYDVHIKSGGKITDFGGWALPVQYSSIIQEHQAVRNSVGLFDVSHMGEILITGENAPEYINMLVTNDVSKMKDCQVMYSPVCYPEGGVVDDVLIYRFDRRKYLMVVNAANTQKDFEWFRQHIQGDVQITDLSDSYAQVAIQGPLAEKTLQKVAGDDLDKIGFYCFAPEMKVGGIDAIVSRTGYTGEDGFEIYVSPGEATRLWDLLLDAGREHGIVPAGLGARDTLRFEAALPLYGHEISRDISPIEAGLSKFVKLYKQDFIGKEILAKQKEDGPSRKLVGFEMVDKGIPRSHYEIFSDDKRIGFVTSGSFSPSLGKNLGLALVDKDYSEEGTEFNVVVRDRPLKARVVRIPFYKKKYV